MLLYSGQQSGAIAVPDFSRMKVVLWVKQLSQKEKTNQNKLLDYIRLHKKGLSLAERVRKS